MSTQISHGTGTPAVPPVSTMKAAMYIAAKVGDVRYLISVVRKPQHDTNPRSSFTPQNNSILHIAALFNQREFAKQVLELAGARALLVHPNSAGNTPFHIAARSGDLDMVKLFIRHFQNNNVEDGLTLGNTLLLTNSYGNTALHEALICNQSKVALRLLRAEPELANGANSCGESPLYLSVQLGIVEVWKKLIHMDQNRISRSGPNNQTPLHAAAMVQGTDNVESLYNVLKDDRRKADLFERTALHYAASNPSSHQLSRLLLETEPELAYKRDRDQLTPLLTAVKFKNWTVFNIILDYCPDCAELRDSSGQNVLHMIINCNLNPSEILKDGKLIGDLINEKDCNGDTPLHLAVKAQFTEGITSLLQYRGDHLRARNTANHTALDLVERWNLVTLKTQYMQKLLHQGATRNGGGLGSESLEEEKAPLDELKQLAENLLVVSTLISTISFTAAFTLPGGYGQSPSDEGLAVLGKKAAFQAFLISDVVAVCSSMACGYVLIRGLIGYIFLRSAMKQAVRFLTVSLVATMVAFSTGLYVVTEKKREWLAISIITASCGLPIFLSLGGHRILTKLPFRRKMIDQPEHEVANRV